MKNKVIAVLTVLLIISFTVIIYQNFAVSEKATHDHSEQSQLYTCGMHPDIISDEPGNCPICEMKLTPIKTGSGSNAMNDGSNEGIVNIDGNLRQTMNIKTVKVERRDLTRKIITNGTVTVDERKEYKISSKIAGWIEKMYVNFEGQKLAAGARLFEIYSPELVAAQEELLTAVEFAKELNPGDYMNNPLVRSSMKKLKYLDLPESVIIEIIAENEIRRTLTFSAAAGGTVINRYAFEGDKIDAGETILHIADLSSLWIKADIYESELSIIKTGHKAVVFPPYNPGDTIKGRISFIDPLINTNTRTVSVRIDVSNNDEKLKPGMIAKVELHGRILDNVLAVEENALIRSGNRNTAILSLRDNNYKPVNVAIGQYAEGYYEVLSGLDEGVSVVTSAQFLIDSESNLKAAVSMFGAGGTDKEEESDQDKRESGLIREGVIDVESIDQNGDGKIFECPMDWNVLSDEYQRCPVCEMKMKEYTIEEVKENLTKYGYEYK